DALVMMYTSDVRLLPPNDEMVTGRDAARAIFGGLIDAGISGDLTSIETKVSGDMGYDLGTYTFMDGDTVVDTGKFIEIFHRGDDGEWLMTNDMWSSDLPAAAPMEESAPWKKLRLWKNKQPRLHLLEAIKASKKPVIERQHNRPVRSKPPAESFRQ
ncbi:MAG: nuclear transport factor 2 family protein, partial [Proteobacteria bacterium]|nr:nuclear transport factor 2 family protein [Pseudomonadota bacterium]